jgi:hypothetical protein
VAKPVKPVFPRGAWRLDTIACVKSALCSVGDVLELGGGVARREKSGCISVCHYIPVGVFLLQHCYYLVPLLGA